jgi:hypothetical protein
MLICQRQQTILRFLSTATKASTRWRVRELYCTYKFCFSVIVLGGIFGNIVVGSYLLLFRRTAQRYGDFLNTAEVELLEDMVSA